MQLSANDRQRSKGYIAALVQLLTECEKQEASIKKKGMSLVLLLLDHMILLHKWLAPPILKPFTKVEFKDIIPRSNYIRW